jgi:hypothetical protein
VLVHHVAVVPEAVPVPLLHLFVVEIEGGVELVFELPLAGVERSGRLQMPNFRGRVQMLRRGHQQRRLLGELACRAKSSLAGTAALGKSVISLVRATPCGVLKPGCTSS